MVTNIFAVFLCTFFIIFSNMGYKVYSQQVSARVGEIPEGTEVVLGNGPQVPFGYENIETSNGLNGYVKKDDLDKIPVQK